jgi:acetate kinase
VRILAVNAGSSSLKLALLEDDERVLSAHELRADAGGFDRRALRALLADLDGIDATGHRIVHGGESFREPVLIDAAALERLHALVELAPLHQPKSLAALEAVRAALPGVPAVACFDTAFHATLPPAASTYALPAAWREREGIRRYGFHGLSHAWVARRTRAMLGARGRGGRIVSAHLGAGASLCAIADGRSVDTTMGFTPLEGLVMATRAGSVDPGALLWLLEHGENGEEPPHRTAHELSEALEHRSGLLALGGSADMRDVLARAAGDERARLAIDVYVHRLRGAIAQMAASLGGLDVLAFTGGIGERSARLRALTCATLTFLGVGIDEARNRSASGQRDGDISAPGVAARTLVVLAREDLEIATQVRAVLAHH